MWHSITPVTSSYDPIVIEGETITQVLLLNSGPANIEAQIWREWNPAYKQKETPDYKLEMRAGNQRLIAGSFVRLTLKDKNAASDADRFAAVAMRVVHSRK